MQVTVANTLSNDPLRLLGVAKCWCLKIETCWPSVDFHHILHALNYGVETQNIGGRVNSPLLSPLPVKTNSVGNMKVNEQCCKYSYCNHPFAKEIGK